MNRFVYSNRAWLLYTILIDHKEISLKHIYEILTGYASDIRFSDYYSLIFAKQFVNLLADNESFNKLNTFILKFNNAFTRNEMKIIKALLENLFNDKNILLATDTNRKLYTDGKISFDDYFKSLILRKELC